MLWVWKTWERRIEVLSWLLVLLVDVLVIAC
jgi:hypothetical protein